MVMNIVLYGVSAEIAGKIAGKYGLKLISTPDKFQPSGTVVLVPPMGTPRQLLAFYNAMLRHEDDVDAVIVCGIESCEAASTVQYCTPREILLAGRRPRTRRTGVGVVRDPRFPVRGRQPNQFLSPGGRYRRSCGAPFPAGIIRNYILPCASGTVA